MKKENEEQFEMKRTQTLEFNSKEYKTLEKSSKVMSVIEGRKISVNRLLKDATIFRANKVLEEKNAK